MKKSFKIFLTLLASAVGLSSCLKDKPLFDPDKMDNVIEFANIGAIESPTTSPYPMFGKSFEVVPEGMLEVFVNYAGDEAVAPQDITVQLGVDANVLTEYNTANKVTYTLIPTNLYSMPTSVVIPKGQRKVAVPIKFKPDQFDLSKTYGLPLVIQSATAGIVSGNFGKVVYRVGAKNKYDGVYSVVSGKVQRYTAPGAPTVNDALNGSLAGNPDVSLSTFGANSVSVPDAGFKWSGGTSGVSGIEGLRIAVDPATNKVTMSSTANPTLANWEGHENYYDPATKTFYLAFRWNPTANRREYEVVLKYKRAR